MVQGTSLRHCKHNGCTRAMGNGSCRGWCGFHYRENRKAEKSQHQTSSKELESVRVRDLGLRLPVRKPFSWEGSLHESVRAMNSEE